jgi:RimJ/RimL family protein N-acetyltransferase
MGQYEPILQETRVSLEKQYDRLTEGQWFFVEKRDGKKIGYICHYLAGAKLTEIGYAIVPGERRKGYGTEAVMIMVDYLFLSKNIPRIQVQTDEENRASQRILKKSEFKKEGIIRKSFFFRGEWRNQALFSILRDEWKKPKILKTIPKESFRKFKV